MGKLTTTGKPRLNYKIFTAEEKIKCMDKIIKYCKEHSDTVYDKDNPMDLYQNCKTMGCTTLFEFIWDHVIEDK